MKLILIMKTIAIVVIILIGIILKNKSRIERVLAKKNKNTRSHRPTVSNRSSRSTISPISDRSSRHAI